MCPKTGRILVFPVSLQQGVSMANGTKVKNLLAVTGMLLFFPIIGKDISGATHIPTLSALKMDAISEVITTV